MLLREFINKKDLDDVDMIDDLMFFMNNDTNFYRKIFFPMISKIRDQIKSGKRCKDTVFRPCVDSAINSYCEKYNISENPISLFTEVDRDEIARKVFAKEKDNVIKGRYDGDQK